MNKLAKPFFLLLLIGSFIVVTSCNDGDEGDDFVAAEIAGTWNYNSFDFAATINGVDFVKWFTDNLGATASEGEAQLEDFAEEANEFEGLVLTINESGSVVVSYPGEPDEEGTWELDESAKTLTITIDGEPLTLDIITLTSSALVGTLTESGEFFDLDQDGTGEILEVSITIGLTK